MSTIVNFRTDENLKNEAENICRALGMNMFLMAMVRERLYGDEPPTRGLFR